MFVSKKKYELVLTLYEQAARELDDFKAVKLSPGELYQCIRECRQVANAVTVPGYESRRFTLLRLEYIDRRLNMLLPAFSGKMPAEEKQSWCDMLKNIPAKQVYGAVYPQQEKKL